VCPKLNPNNTIIKLRGKVKTARMWLNRKAVRGWEDSAVLDIFSKDLQCFKGGSLTLPSNLSPSLLSFHQYVLQRLKSTLKPLYPSNTAYSHTHCPLQLLSSAIEYFLYNELLHWYELLTESDSSLQGLDSP